MIMERMEEIMHMTRRRGNTSWLLKAAMRSGKVMIVCGNQQMKTWVCNQYWKMYKARPWWFRVWHDVVVRRQPVFVCLSDHDDAFRDTDHAIVYDLNCFSVPRMHIGSAGGDNRPMVSTRDQAPATHHIIDKETNLKFVFRCVDYGFLHPRFSPKSLLDMMEREGFVISKRTRPDMPHYDLFKKKESH